MTVTRNLRESDGFTLVELLISTAVLGALLLLITQITNSTSTATRNSSKHMEADSYARAVFDRMATDFSKIVKRKDVDFVVLKQAGNDAMWFYSEAPANFPTKDANNVSIDANDKSSVALIGYRINSSYSLERLGKGLTWDRMAAPSSMLFLTYPSGSSTPLSASTIAGAWPTTVSTTSTDSDYVVLSEQTYRLEFCFQLKDGTLSAAQPTAGLQNVSAIIVGLGMLDTSSRKIVKKDPTKATVLDSAVASQMITALQDAVDGTPIAQTWEASNYLSNSGIPTSAAAQLRIYQRSFYLNTR